MATHITTKPSAPAPPPRRTRHRAGTAVLPKGRERNEAILDAATAILIDDGYAALSMRKIATRAGMHIGHLQYYYPTKQDVVRAMLERYLDDAVGRVAARIAQSGADPAACALSALDAILADQESAETCRFFWELWALAARDAAIATAMRAFYERYWREVVTTLVAANPALGRARAGRRAALLVALLEGLTLFRSRENPCDLPLPGLKQELRALLRHFVSDVGA